jgi:hypothetical protein
VIVIVRGHTEVLLMDGLIPRDRSVAGPAGQQMHKMQREHGGYQKVDRVWAQVL